MTWYRVHYRNGSEVCEGEAELERLRARRVPKVVHVEDALTYTCADCGFVGAWWTTNDRSNKSWGGKWPPDGGWAWFGYYTLKTEEQERKRVVLKIVCPTCRPAEMPISSNRHWSHYEPLPEDHQGSWGIVWKARKEADPRKFPFPEHPKERTGNGWCRWCGKPVEKPARTWHPECLREFNLHTNVDAQFAFLVKRDGWGCGVCGRSRGHVVSAGLVWHDPIRQTGQSRLRFSIALQVDHVIPLWSVYHLPPDERRIYFGPDNLWLLCELHHRGKTAMEARDRAAARLAAE